MRSLWIPALLWVLSALQPCSAAAVQLRQTQSFHFDSMSWTVYATDVLPIPQPAPHVQAQTLHFEAFDPSLGTLTGAYLSYEGDYAISYAIAAGTRAPYWYEQSVCGGDVIGNGTVFHEFGLKAPGIAQEKVLHTDSMWSSVRGLRCSGLIWLKGGGTGPADAGGNTGVNPWLHAGDLDLPLLSLADGLDVLNGPVDVELDKEMNAYLWFSVYVDPLFSYIANFRNEWSGQVALTYVYQAGLPVPTPEPGSLLLLCGGLLALRAGAGAARRARGASWRIGAAHLQHQGHEVETLGSKRQPLQPSAPVVG